MQNKNVKLLLYCTKAMPSLVHFEYGTGEYRCFGHGKESQDLVFEKEGFNPNDISDYLNGKVVAECDCDLVEEIKLDSHNTYCTNKLNEDELLEMSCLDLFDFVKYLNKDKGYAIHIKNVKPFDTPKKLNYYNITMAPQNMCYLRDKDGNIIAIVISIQAMHMCNILNGKKSIEVRTSIVNILKELMYDA